MLSSCIHAANHQLLWLDVAMWSACLGREEPHMMVAMVMHMLPNISDVLTYLKKSELAGIVGGPKGRRLATKGGQLLGLGSCLWRVSAGHFAAVSLTRYGDVFYQCWRYRSSSSDSASLTVSCFQGYKVWLDKQAQRQAPQLVSVEMRYPATVRDMTSIARCVVDHNVANSPTRTAGNSSDNSTMYPDNTTECVDDTTECADDTMECVGNSELQASCCDLCVRTKLDKAILRVWDVPAMKLFSEEDKPGAQQASQSSMECSLPTHSTSLIDHRDSPQPATLSWDSPHPSFSRDSPLPSSSRDSPHPSSSRDQSFLDSPFPSSTKQDTDMPTSISQSMKRKIGF